MQVGKFLQLISTFLGGFIIAFARGWLLSLVMLSSIPPVVASAAVMSLVLSKLSNRSQMAYAEAGKVVEQTIGSIRTVISLFQKLIPIYFLSLANFSFSFMKTGGIVHWGEESN